MVKTKEVKHTREELEKIKTTLKFIQVELLVNELTFIVILLKQLLCQ